MLLPEGRPADGDRTPDACRAADAEPVPAEQQSSQEDGLRSAPLCGPLPADETEEESPAGAAAGPSKPGLPRSAASGEPEVGIPTGPAGAIAVSSTAGIENLGNTCFMNSSLQCLANIPSLREYFLTDAYKDALRFQGMVTEQTQGDLAEGFAALLRRLWADSSKTVAPWDFKRLVARFASQFSGYRQHDSMEFIEYLIDGLKEDCNKVKGKKPYIERTDSNGRPDHEVALEAGNKSLLRNDSAIDDMFVGFMRSMTRCPEPSCKHESVVFDPFLSVKVPLQSHRQSSDAMFTVTVVPLVTSQEPMTRQAVAVKRSGSVGDLIEAAAAAAGLKADGWLLLELYNGRVYKTFDAIDQLEDISASDILLMYELPEARVFAPPPARRWGPGDSTREGDVVQVASSFSSNNECSQELHKGLYGKVVTVDEVGDASIKFDGIHMNQWVFRDNLGLLRVDLAGRSEEKRRCPHDNKIHTLRSLVHEWDAEYSLHDLLDYWRDAMRPLVLPDPPPRCGIIVHFRRWSHMERRRELFGVPALFSMPRDTLMRRLADMVRDELAQRFGADAANGWSLFRSDSGVEVLKADTLFWDDELQMPGDDAQNEVWLKEREHLVLEWKGDIPPNVLRVFKDVEPHAEEEETSVTLETCFEWLAEEEQLSEFDAVYCGKCKQHRQMYKKVDLWSMPPVLVLQLKRFESDNRQRLSTPVRYPLEGLDLQRFCLSRAASFPNGACVRAGQRVIIRGIQSAAHQHLNGRQAEVMYLDTNSARFCVRLQDGDPKVEWKRFKPENLEAVPGDTKTEDILPMYDLIAMSKHIGDSRFGHYAAYVRSSVDGKWRLFDDEFVKEVPAREVETERVGAYVLFYLRRDGRPASWG